MASRIFPRPRSLVLTALASIVLSQLVAAAPAAGEPHDLKTLLASADPAVQVQWGERYEHAEGVPRDPAAAIKLYCHAARAGSHLAAYDLGWLYANGHGVARDDGLAAAWFEIAAKRGDRYARRMLGFLDVPRPLPPARCRLPDGSDYRVVHSVPNPSRRLVAQWVETLAPEYELDPRLVLAVIRAESNFDPRARSPRGACGLMQLIPATARRFGVADVWDPLQNLRGGMAYLRWLLDHFDGNVRLALAGYNAGEQAVADHQGVPPYHETQAYVQRVLALRGPAS